MTFNEWINVAGSFAFLCALLLYAWTMWKWQHPYMAWLLVGWALTQGWRTIVWLWVALPNGTHRPGPMLEPVSWILNLVPAIAFWAAYKVLLRTKKARDSLLERLKGDHLTWSN